MVNAFVHWHEIEEPREALMKQCIELNQMYEKSERWLRSLAVERKVIDESF